MKKQSETRNAMATVSLVSAPADLVPAIDRALALIGRQNCVRPGDRVLIKPNLHGGPGHTSAAFVEALTCWALDQGARQVTIGDGGFWGMKDGGPYFAYTGLTAVAERTGARLVFFHDGPYRVLRPEHEAAPETLGISEHVHEADVVLNVPIPKTHFNTLITIALKNVKGCLRPQDKKRLHELDLPAALAVVNTLIAPLVAVNLLDGTTGYEGMGPGHATPFPWGVIAASTDPVALDATACRLMMIDPERVKLVQESVRLGVGVAAESEIEIVGERLADHQRRFVLPHEALSATFPGLRIMSEKACSVCMESLFNALQTMEKEQRDVGPLCVLIGQGPTSEADILIGRCAGARAGDDAGVPGCPPAPGAICELFAKHRQARSANGVPSGSPAPDGD